MFAETLSFFESYDTTPDGGANRSLDLGPNLPGHDMLATETRSGNTLFLFKWFVLQISENKERETERITDDMWSSNLHGFLSL